MAIALPVVAVDVAAATANLRHCRGCRRRRRRCRSRLPSSSSSPSRSVQWLLSRVRLRVSAFSLVEFLCSSSCRLALEVVVGGLVAVCLVDLMIVVVAVAFGGAARALLVIECVLRVRGIVVGAVVGGFGVWNVVVALALLWWLSRPALQWRLLLLSLRLLMVL